LLFDTFYLSPFFFREYLTACYDNMKVGSAESIK